MSYVVRCSTCKDFTDLDTGRWCTHCGHEPLKSVERDRCGCQACWDRRDAEWREEHESLNAAPPLTS